MGFLNSHSFSHLNSRSRWSNGGLLISSPLNSHSPSLISPNQTRCEWKRDEFRHNVLCFLKRRRTKHHLETWSSQFTLPWIGSVTQFFAWSLPKTDSTGLVIHPAMLCNACFCVYSSRARVRLDSNSPWRYLFGLILMWFQLTKWFTMGGVISVPGPFPI